MSLAIAAALASCMGNSGFSGRPKPSVGQKSPRGRQAALTCGLVTADAETEPVESGIRQDAADDPAIWIHPDDPARSFIIGTNKRAGLHVYDLSGKELHFYPIGSVNNVDVRYGFRLNNGTSADLVACTERINNEIRIFGLDRSDGSLAEITAEPLKVSEPELYGFCLYHSHRSGKYYAISNCKSGIIQQWELYPVEGDLVSGGIISTRRLPSQPEGMVADDETGYLYVGEEHRGIWKFDAEPGTDDEPVFIEGSGSTNPNIMFDIEGLAIYCASGGRGYLIASSQGNNSYAVFDRQDNHSYIGSFRIADGTIDGTEDTDGIEVACTSLPGYFPSGVFIAQDGHNYEGNSRSVQNFKLVSWEKIARSFTPTLIIDNSCRVYTE